MYTHHLNKTYIPYLRLWGCWIFVNILQCIIYNSVKGKSAQKTELDSSQRTSNRTETQAAEKDILMTYRCHQIWWQMYFSPWGGQMDPERLWNLCGEDTAPQTSRGPSQPTPVYNFSVSKIHKDINIQ